MWQALAASSLALSMLGCTVDAIDYAERECPCIDGWVCDETANVCVPRTDASLPRTDGAMGVDAPASMRDAGPRVDAGTPDEDSGTSMVVDAGHDAGASDSGPPDGGPPASRCETDFAGRLFCDGFESGDVSRWDGEEIGAGAGTVSVVTDIVYMGDNALRVQGDPGSGYAGVGKVVFAASGVTDQWYRAYHYFPAANGFGAEVNGMAESGLAYDIVVAINPSSSNFHTHSWPVNHRVDVAGTLPADTWSCIELHVHFDASGGVIQLYFDDALVAEDTMLDTTVPRGLQVVLAGFTWKDSASTNVVYVDEVVADTARIGCD